MPLHPLTRTIEECCLNAWPGLRQRVLDGWLLRFSDGFTSRANSVNALHAGTRSLEDKLAHCEAAYRAVGQPTIFRVTPLAELPELDDLLERRGYLREKETVVQLLDPLPAFAEEDGCELVDALDPHWEVPLAELNEVPVHHRATHRAILRHIAPAHTGAVLRIDGTVACCGRAVTEDEQVGLFAIATDPAQRRRGHARRLVRHLLAWGGACGARRAYLQVEADNLGALRLYEELGFREIYRYWYRRQR